MWGACVQNTGSYSLCYLRRQNRRWWGSWKMLNFLCCCFSCCITRGSFHERTSERRLYSRRCCCCRRCLPTPSPTGHSCHGPTLHCVSIYCKLLAKSVLDISWWHHQTSRKIIDDLDTFRMIPWILCNWVIFFNNQIGPWYHQNRFNLRDNL